MSSRVLLDYDLFVPVRMLASVLGWLVRISKVLFVYSTVCMLCVIFQPSLTNS